MSDQEIIVNVMRDGSIQVFGPEPSASELRTSLDSFFEKLDIVAPEDKVETIRNLLKDVPNCGPIELQ